MHSQLAAAHREKQALKSALAESNVLATAEAEAKEAALQRLGIAEAAVATAAAAAAAATSREGEGVAWLPSIPSEALGQSEEQVRRAACALVAV